MTVCYCYKSDLAGMDPIGFFLQYWSRYAAVTPEQGAWVQAYAGIVAVRRGTILFDPDEPDRAYSYFVCQGLLATLWWDTGGARHIARFLPPEHSVHTRLHLHSSQPIPHQLVALRHSLCLRLPADLLRAYKEQDHGVSTLVHVLQYQAAKQYLHKDLLLGIAHPVYRYLAFCHHPAMQTIVPLTTQQEQAEYLGISRMSITRARQQLSRMRTR